MAVGLSATGLVATGLPPTATAVGGAFSAWWAAGRSNTIGLGLNIMYPKNAASPERIHLGPVVQISDGAVQTSGVSISVVPQGGTTAAGGGTTSYENGVVFYLPTQAETNYTSFIITAYKTGCIPTSTTVITTASATAGKVVLSGETHTSAVIPTVTDLTTKTGFSLASTGLDAIVSTATGMVEIAKAIWDRVLTAANHNIANSAGKRLRAIDAAFEVHSGTAQAGSTSTTFVMDTGANSTSDNIYRGDRIVITAGTGIGEHGIIKSYVASTRTATMSQTWLVTPNDTSEFAVVPADCDVETWNHSSVTGDGDWAELQIDVDDILVDTAVIGAAGAGLTAVPWNAAWDAEVQSEVNDGLVAYNAASTTNITAGTITTATNVTTVNGLANNVITAAATAADFGAELADAVWDEAIAGHLTAGTVGVYTAVGGGILVDGAVTGTPTSTVFTFTGGSTVNGFYNDQTIYVLSGTGLGQARPILSSAYSGGTTTITVDEPFAVTPVATDRFVITSSHVHPISQIADKILLRKLDRTGDGTDAINERTVVNALRAVRNKVSISGGTATVTKEDDTTTAWTAAVATTPGDPISSVDPT